MTIPEKAWKWIAAALAAILVLLVVALAGIFLWARIQMGVNAAVYIDSCVSAGFCPSGQVISKTLEAKSPEVKSNVPPPPPPTPAADSKAPVVPEKK